MGDKKKTAECLQIAISILQSEMGENDPDCEYFRQLEKAIW